MATIQNPRGFIAAMMASAGAAAGFTPAIVLPLDLRTATADMTGSSRRAARPGARRATSRRAGHPGRIPPAAARGRFA